MTDPAPQRAATPSHAVVARGVLLGLLIPLAAPSVWATAGCACLRADPASWSDADGQPPPPRGDAQRLRDDVTMLATTIGPRSPVQPDALVAARLYIESELKIAGYAPERQHVTEIAGEQYDNVIVRCGGRGAAHANEETLVIGAHYDSHPDTPGADDNASGTAAVLELARHLVNADCGARVVELVFYTLEEPPYFRSTKMGSAVHAAALKKRRARVRGMVSVEMVGYFDDTPGSQTFPSAVLGLRYPDVGNFLALIGRPSDSDFVEAVAPRLAAQSVVPIYAGTAPASIPGVDFSDHLNYWDAGFTGAMLTDTAFLRNTAYHEDTDTPQRLDYARMAAIVDGLYALSVGDRP